MIGSLPVAAVPKVEIHHGAFQWLLLPPSRPGLLENKSDARKVIFITEALVLVLHRITVTSKQREIFLTSSQPEHLLSGEPSLSKSDLILHV